MSRRLHRVVGRVASEGLMAMSRGQRRGAARVAVLVAGLPDLPLKAGPAAETGHARGMVRLRKRVGHAAEMPRLRKRGGWKSALSAWKTRWIKCCENCASCGGKVLAVQGLPTAIGLVHRGGEWRLSRQDDRRRARPLVVRHGMTADLVRHRAAVLDRALAAAVCPVAGGGLTVPHQADRRESVVMMTDRLPIDAGRTISR
jgi:hypothetical protein